MNKIHEWANTGLIVLVAVLVLVGGHNQPVPQHKQGSADFVSNYNAIELSQGQLNVGSTTQISKLKVGVSSNGGTSFNKIGGGLCYIFPYAASIAGQQVGVVTCQATAAAGTAGAIATLTGITTNDNIVATVSSTTANNIATTSATLVVNSPLWVVSANASSTSGYITLTLYNSSTSPYVWPTSGTASGTAYWFSGN